MNDTGTTLPYTSRKDTALDINKPGAYGIYVLIRLDVKRSGKDSYNSLVAFLIGRPSPRAYIDLISLRISQPLSGSISSWVRGKATKVR